MAKRGHQPGAGPGRHDASGMIGRGSIIVSVLIQVGIENDLVVGAVDDDPLHLHIEIRLRDCPWCRVPRVAWISAGFPFTRVFPDPLRA